jgi:hypothetical protein
MSFSYVESNPCRLAHDPSQDTAVPALINFSPCFVLTDFAEERRHLLEMVGPELQSQYDQMGLEVSSSVRQIATALGTQSCSYTVKVRVSGVICETKPDV